MKGTRDKDVLLPKQIWNIIRPSGRQANNKTYPSFRWYLGDLDETFQNKFTYNVILDEVREPKQNLNILARDNNLR